MIQLAMYKTKVNVTISFFHWKLLHAHARARTHTFHSFDFWTMHTKMSHFQVTVNHSHRKTFFVVHALWRITKCLRNGSAHYSTIQQSCSYSLSNAHKMLTINESYFVILHHVNNHTAMEIQTFDDVEKKATLMQVCLSITMNWCHVAKPSS